MRHSAFLPHATRGPIATSYKSTRKSTRSSLAPMAPAPQFSTRSETRSSLKTKTWRQEMFQSPSPASKREVELLGEWLNSVLAENLEQNSNPLDVCSNAQHWFSVAFNELVRQVSVDCAERGRLFAVIWKRNQDLLAKLVQIQKEEREYILSCHKERMQFLKTDLEFSKSRLETISSTYNEEQLRWNSSHQRDVSKFDSIQQKIDDQTRDRQKLLEELHALQTQLGLPQEDPVQNPEEFSFSTSLSQLEYRCQNLLTKMRYKPIILEDLSTTIKDATHFNSRSEGSFRTKFEKYLQTIPESAMGNTRPVTWLFDAISYLYSFYIAQIVYRGLDEMRKRSIMDVFYDIFLGMFGNREHAESVLFDLLWSVRSHLDGGSIRIYQFARFIGLVEPLPITVFHFYLYVLCVINKEHTGPIFPDVESGDQLISGIPAPVICTAAEKIFKRFTQGRTLKFYTDRVSKIAADGYMHFGGKNMAEMDTVTDYILTTFVEEQSRLDETVTEIWKKVPAGKITNYSQFYQCIVQVKRKPDAIELPGIMRKFSADHQQGTGLITNNDFNKIMKDLDMMPPFILTEADFQSEQNPDDILKFMTSQLNESAEIYDKIVARLNEIGDETLIKQLRSAKAKFEQAISSHNIGQTFMAIQREYYEKITLAQIYIQSR